MTKNEWHEYMSEVCGPIEYTCICCRATTDKPTWARSFGGGYICPNCERHFTTLDAPLPVEYVGDDPYARPNEFEDEREAAMLSDRHGR